MTKGKRKGGYRTASTSASNSPSLNSTLALPPADEEAAAQASATAAASGPSAPATTEESVANLEEQVAVDPSEAEEPAQPILADAATAPAADDLAATGDDQQAAVEALRAADATDEGEPTTATATDESAEVAERERTAADFVDVDSPAPPAAVDSDVKQDEGSAAPVVHEESTIDATEPEPIEAEQPVASTSTAEVESHVESAAPVEPGPEDVEAERQVEPEPEPAPTSNYSSKPKRSAAAKKPPPPPTPAPKPKQGTGKKGSAKGTPKLDDTRELFKDEIVVEKRGARAARAGAKKLIEVDEDEGFLLDDEEDEADDGGEGVTRCICGEDTVEKEQELMIQCDTCKCWQHGPCVGLMEEEECPDRYFCELCKPTWHGPNGQIRKTHRKVTAGPRSPAVPPAGGAALGPAPPTGSVGRGQKPRESADAALVSAYLAADVASHPGDLPVAAVRHESRSISPSHPQGQAGGKHEPVPKKRKTMNSRDAAYDDAIALSILESGSGAMRAKLEKRNVSGSVNEDEDYDAAYGVEGTKKGRTSFGEAGAPPMLEVEAATPLLGGDETMTELDAGDVKGDIAMEEDGQFGDGSSGAAAPARAKHPNQYTYRPKNGPTPSGRGRGSPVKRGSGRDANGSSSHTSNGSTGMNASGVTMASAEHQSRTHRPQRDWVPGHDPSGWGMPEHLKHLSHLLPTPSPQAIQVPCKRPRDDGPPSSTVEASTSTAPEAPTKVRFPNKRITMPEMRKRARNVLEYLTRVQIEMSEREKRVEHAAAAMALGGAGSSAATAKIAAVASPVENSESMRMMDDLTKEIILFQQKFFEP